MAVRTTWFYPALFVLLWSTGWIGAKLGLPYAEAFTFLELRFLLVVAILIPLCWLSKAAWPRARDAAHIALAGLLMQGGYLGGVFASMEHGMPAGLSALIVGMQPLATALLSGWLLHERVTRRQWLGLVLGLAGVLLVIGDRMKVEGLTAPALWFSALALAGITLGTVWQKRHGGGVDLRTASAIQFMAAGAVLAPFALFLETNTVRWTGEFVFALAWLVLVLSIGAIFLLLHLIRQGAATKVASLFYLVPPSTALMAWMIFGETYSLLAAAGMGLAMLAVWMVSTGK
jgi:drug/metabolite transporter (DMT)-like permease